MSNNTFLLDLTKNGFVVRLRKIKVLNEPIGIEKIVIFIINVISVLSPAILTGTELAAVHPHPPTPSLPLFGHKFRTNVRELGCCNELAMWNDTRKSYTENSAQITFFETHFSEVRIQGA